MCSIVDVNDRYYMDCIGFIQEQLSVVVKVNFWVEGKIKVSFLCLMFLKCLCACSELVYFFLQFLLPCNVHVTADAVTGC
jgi:hypothetical protein